MQILLYDYWRSSASYRVRIALNLKGVAYERFPIDLLDSAQKRADYRARNPQGFVPMLEVDGRPITQSLAIMGWLDRAFPDPPLVPANSDDRAHVVAMAMVIVTDVHPLNNLRVLKRLKALGVYEEARDDWIRHWIGEGFAAIEALAARQAGRYLFGDAPSVADVCLVPQMYNARRFEVDLEPYPTLARVDAEASALDAFAAAHPDRFAPAAASR